jgi:hypothetical protein
MTTEDPIEHETATCQTCGAEFKAAILRSPFDRWKTLFQQRYCDPCVESVTLRLATEQEETRLRATQARFEAQWAEICPDAFRTLSEGGRTDPIRLAVEQPALGEILTHPFGPQGLILRGNTGGGKTRCMFRLLRRYYEQTPTSTIIAMSAGQFDREARDAAGTFTLSAWFDRLAGCDALFIDDLGKGRWTPATAGQFWEVVDDRTKHGRPLYLTTNASGETLVKAWELDRDIAEPLIRRLRENCKGIVLKVNTESKETK